MQRDWLQSEEEDIDLSMKNNIKYFFSLLRDNLGVLFCYFYILVFLYLFLLFDNNVDTVNKIMLEFLRFSFFPVLFFIAYRVLRTHKIIHIIKNEDFSHFAGDCKVYQSFIDCINKYKKCYLDFRNQELQSQKEDYDYIVLWSHELKLPLAALSLIINELDSEYYLVAHRQIKKAEYQVKMLLNYKKLDVLNYDIMFQKTSLLEVVQRVIKDISSLIIDKNIAIQIDIENGTILTDEKWISFIIEQLISNAVKYSYDNKVVSIIWDESKTTLIVKDEGIGILKSDLPRIFDAGFTGKNGRQFGSSTGMGLYMVDKMVSMLGAKIEVSSEVNKGTNFYIIFPSEYS